MRACGSLLAPTDETASACTAVVAALTVLVGMPDVLRSRESNVMELEYACRFDSCQVLAARLIVLGLSDVVVLTFAVLAVPALAGTDPLLVFLHACAPFFLTAAGSLRIATRAREGVTARCLVFGTLVATLAVMAWQAAPRLYAASAAGLWAVLFALALVAAALETKAYLSSVAAGLDCLGAPAQPCPPATGAPCATTRQSLTQRDAALAPCATNANEPLARRIGGRKGQGPWNSPLTG